LTVERVEMSKPFVAILMGAGPDLPVMKAAFGVLGKLDIQQCEAK
jgi:phosphoribosylcarboxyaminoimidazole (NCAIR) mutase